MDEKSLTSMLSQLIPDGTEVEPGEEGEIPDEQKSGLVEILKAAASQSGGSAESAVNEFLNGEGDLFETTRTALATDRASAESQVADFLMTKLKLSSFTAKLVAMLAVKLFPSIAKLTGEETQPKKKTRRKKRKTSSSEKTEASSKKKPKKKTTARPKTASSKPAAKKKPTSKTGRKKTTTKKKAKQTTRTSSVLESPENP